MWSDTGRSGVFIAILLQDVDNIFIYFVDSGKHRKKHDFSAFFR